MIDYSRIVDDLRSAICSANAEWVDYLRSAAADYAVACEEVNERLRKCGEYLRKGLRSEALQLAEIDPNLLDSVAILDFPELGQCCQILSHYGIRTPTPLLLDIAADLNEAYAVEQPMATLLARHRLLALAHSPLRLRIATLRELATVDGNNPVWQQDLLEFEREWLKHFQSDVAEAVKRSDLAAVTALEAEIASQEWQELPPQSLVQWTATMRNNLSNKHGRSALENCAHQLNAAYSAFDVVAGRNARNLWNELTAQFAISAGDSLLEFVQPALDWLVQEDQREAAEAGFRQAVSSLEFALDRNAELTELERTFHRANQFPYELSDYLVARYEKRLAQLQQQARRQQTLKLILIGSGAIAATILVATAIYIPMRASQINTHADRLSNLISEARYEEANVYLEKLEKEAPRLAMNSRIEDLRLRLQGLQKKEADRQVEFNQLADQFAAALTELRNETSMLETLRAKAKTAQERARLMQLESDSKALASRLQREQDEAFISKLSAMEDRVREIENERGRLIEERRQRLAKARAELRLLETESQKVGHAVRSQMQVILGRLTDLDLHLEREVRQSERAKEITRTVGKDTDFCRALEEYMREFPGTERSVDFKRALGEAKLWNMVDAWNTIAAELAARPLGEITPEMAKAQIDLAQDFKAKCKEFPGCQILEIRLPYLLAIAGRQANGQGIEQKLQRLYSDPLVADLWKVSHANGKTYYGRSQPKVAEGKVTGYSYVYQFDFSEKNVGLRPESVKAFDVAPQSKIAGELKQLLANLSDKTWDLTFYRLLEKIHQNVEMDPILKLNLLQQTYEIGRQGSLVFENTFSEYGKALKETRVNPFANWLDPDDDEAERQRALAKETLAKLPAFSSLNTRAKAESEKVRRAVANVYRWTGWLSRTTGDSWQCTGERTPSENGELLVLIADANGKPELRSIGVVKSKTVQFKTGVRDALAEGRPVYFVASDEVSN